MINITYRDPITGKPSDPLPSQAILHASKCKYRCYEGGYGSGKTEWGCQETILKAEQFPNNYILVARRHFSDLRDTTMKSFFELLPAERNPFVGDPKAPGKCTWKGVDKQLTFPNGTIVIFRHLDDPDRLKSLNLGAYYIDEAIEEGCEYAWKILKARLRLQTASRQGWITTNPGAMSSWIEREFTGRRSNKNRYHIVNASSLENIHLTRDYVDDLYDLPDEEFQMYVLGKPVAARGAIFSQFRRDIHVVPPFPIPYDWMRIRSIDVGMDHPFVCLWGAVDPDGPAVYIYREWVQQDLNIEDNCEIVKQLSTGEQYMMTAIDPSTKARQIGTGMPVIEQVRQYLEGVLPADNSVSAGVTRMRTVLSYDVDASQKVIRPPRFFITDECPETARQIESLQYDVKRGRSTGKPLKKDDDCWDAAKYLLLSLQGFDTVGRTSAPEPETVPQRCHRQAMSKHRPQRRRSTYARSG